MTTQTYHYHPQTGLFMGHSPTEFSPLEPEVPLIPGFATLTPPPQHGADDVCSFNRVTNLWEVDVGALARQRAQQDAEAAARVAAASHPDAIQRRLTAAVQAHLDTTAQSWGYTNMATAVTYAGEPAVAQFQAEGAALRAWRSLVWQHCYSVMAAVQAAQRAIPSEATLIAELPAISRPGA